VRIACSRGRVACSRGTPREHAESRLALAAAGARRGSDPDAAKALEGSELRKLSCGLHGVRIACSRGVPREHATRRCTKTPQAHT
jgi:hypothetical protein